MHPPGSGAWRRRAPLYIATLAKEQHTKSPDDLPLDHCYAKTRLFIFNSTSLTFGGARGAAPLTACLMGSCQHDYPPAVELLLAEAALAGPRLDWSNVQAALEAVDQVRGLMAPVGF